MSAERHRFMVDHAKKPPTPPEPNPALHRAVIRIETGGSGIQTLTALDKERAVKYLRENGWEETNGQWHKGPERAHIASCTPIV